MVMKAEMLLELDKKSKPTKALFHCAPKTDSLLIPTKYPILDVLVQIFLRWKSRRGVALGVFEDCFGPRNR